MATPFGHTAHGFETQFGTNHLGHFVLVNRIAALMGAGSRLINLSSSGHRYSNVDLDGAMLFRNSLILAILALQAFAFSLVPMLIMLAATAILPHFSPCCGSATRLLQIRMDMIKACIIHTIAGNW